MAGACWSWVVPADSRLGSPERERSGPRLPPELEPDRPPGPLEREDELPGPERPPPLRLPSR